MLEFFTVAGIFLLLGATVWIGTKFNRWLEEPTVLQPLAKLYIRLRRGRASLQAYENLLGPFRKGLVDKLRKQGVADEHARRVLPTIALRSRSEEELRHHLDTFERELLAFIDRLKKGGTYSSWVSIDNSGASTLDQLLDLRVFSSREYVINDEYPSVVETYEVGGTLETTDPSSSMFDVYRYSNGSVGNSPSYTVTEVTGDRRFYLKAVN